MSRIREQSVKLSYVFDKVDQLEVSVTWSFSGFLSRWSLRSFGFAGHGHGRISASLWQFFFVHVHAYSETNCILVTLFLVEVGSPMTRILNRLNIDLDENDENAMDYDT